jgi:signal peptidase I
MDFALIMFVALAITGVIWAGDRLLLAPRRLRAVAALGTRGAAEDEIDRAGREPVIVEYARAFFPVILLVFLLRSFLVEPFRIPSGSMMPGLLSGDFILVNKFTYGIRLPVINQKVIGLNSPKRGDVMVFRFPADPSTNFIKRVIGLPGDQIVYRDKQLTINGQPAPQSLIGDYTYTEREQGERLLSMRRLTERLDGNEHEILVIESGRLGNMEFTVPEGQYFVMGDNRDRSNDSRFWGTVPEENIVGKAFLIWFSVADDGFAWEQIAWKRMGNSIR